MKWTFLANRNQHKSAKLTLIAMKSMQAQLDPNEETEKKQNKETNK